MSYYHGTNHFSMGWLLQSVTLSFFLTTAGAQLSEGEQVTTYVVIGIVGGIGCLVLVACLVRHCYKSYMNRNTRVSGGSADTILAGQYRNQLLPAFSPPPAYDDCVLLSYSNPALTGTSNGDLSTPGVANGGSGQTQTRTPDPASGVVLVAPALVTPPPSYDQVLGGGFTLIQPGHTPNSDSASRAARNQDPSQAAIYSIESDSRRSYDGDVIRQVSREGSVQDSSSDTPSPHSSEAVSANVNASQSNGCPNSNGILAHHNFSPGSDYNDTGNITDRGRQQNPEQNAIGCDENLNDSEGVSRAGGEVSASALRRDSSSEGPSHGDDIPESHEALTPASTEREDDESCSQSDPGVDDQSGDVISLVSDQSHISGTTNPAFIMRDEQDMETHGKGPEIDHYPTS